MQNEIVLFYKRQELLRKEFLKLPPSKRIVFSEGNYFDVFSHCPLCGEKTLMHANNRYYKDYGLCQQSGVHECANEKCLSLFKDALAKEELFIRGLYFNHFIRVHKDGRMTSLDAGILKEARSTLTFSYFLMKSALSFKKFLKNLFRRN